MTRNKRLNRSIPKAWWQRAIAGERLPKDLFRSKSKCAGSVEDHRPIALDVRELIRKHVFEQPVGSVFHLNLRFPWLRVVIGERMGLECPLCGRALTDHSKRSQNFSETAALACVRRCERC